MSHASKLLLLCWLASTFACTVRTLEELDEERPIEICSAEHPTCAPGAVCFENRCIRTEGLDCVPGTRVACGSEEGECRQGTQLCGAEGLFGACEDEVKPVFESCDGKDNDCDGSLDAWSGPVELTRNHDLDTPAAAIAVRRASDGTQDTLLSLMAENGSIVASTLSADGTWKRGRTFTHSQMSFKLPALAAQGDTVAAAWLGVKPPVGTEPYSYRVFLAMLDGSGAALNEQVLEIPYGTLGVEASQLKLAINKTHVLVLITTSSESVVVTVSRNLDVASRKGPFRLGTVHSGRWFHATAGGTGEQFVVAYEDTYFNPTNGFTSKYNYTAVVSNEGVLLGNQYVLNKSMPSHSPFILPLQGDGWDYTVYYAENGFDTAVPKRSRISFTRCRELACETPGVFATFDHEVARLQVVARPGALKPELALYRWQDSRTDPPSLTVATFADKAEWRNELQPPGQPVLSESLVVMPDSTRYLLYNQYPPPPSAVSSQAVGPVVTEAHLLPFCSP